MVDAITIHAILNYKQLTQGVEQMQKQIEKKILDFTKLTGLAERITMSHGTLYVTLLPVSYTHLTLPTKHAV